MKNSNKKYYQTLFLLLTLFLLIAYSLQLNATVRFVSKTGNSTPPYTSWATAADSIQKCINVCALGDTIYVANGVYQEQVVMIPGLSLIGAGMDSCVIDIRDLVTAANYTAVYVAVDGLFTGFNILVYYDSNMGYGIRNVGDGSCLVTMNKITTGGIGIYAGSNPTIYKNIFSNVSQGVRLFNSSAIVRSNEIYTDPNSQSTIVTGIYIEAFNNSYHPVIDSNYIAAGRGNGIRKSVGSTPIITYNFITFTQYGGDAIFLSSSDSAYVYNNLILIGTGIRGIYNSSVPYLQVVNNYIQGRSILSPTGMVVGGSNTVKNNVVVNTVTGISAGGIQDFDFRYNNVWNNDNNYAGFTPDTTNLSVDPMIVNDDTTKGELDFHLQAYSPLIDAGDPTILDRDGSRSDIGLYGGPYGESYTYQGLAPKPPRGLFASIADSTITLSWEKNTEADFSNYNLYRDTAKNFSIDSTKLIASLTDTFYLQTIPTGIESLYFKLTGVDSQGNQSNPSEEVGISITSVRNEWKPLNNYILYQNYPNPFNPSTRIGYKLKERGYVKLYVYDVKGELVEVLVNQTQEAGYYEVQFNGDGKHQLSSGIYIYQIIVSSGNNIPVYSDIKKMLLIK